MQPFVKWLGGKTQILQEILDLFPRVIKGDYYEPFIGGGSVLIGFLERVEQGVISFKGNKIVASDLNEDLINAYNQIKTNPEELILELSKFVDLSSEFYYSTRTTFNNSNNTAPKKRAAMFIFLNKTCFRGVYRVNKSGGFNVPFGNPSPNAKIFSEDNINNLSDLFNKYNVTFIHSGYKNILVGIKNRVDFVYIDPPYVPIAKDSFVSYTASGFPKEEHENLFSEIHKLVVEKGVGICMSNSASEPVISAFSSKQQLFSIREISCRRSISRDPSSNAKEVIIISKNF